MTEVNPFDELANAYDSSINWNNRLHHEIPFLLHSVNCEENIALDLACGTGRHAIALTKKGFAVTGIDSSRAMITIAKENAEHSKTKVHFITGDIASTSVAFETKYCLIYCLGNSLALLPTLEAVKQTLCLVQEALSDNGVFVFQVLNFEAIRETNFRFFPMNSGKMATGEEVIFTRFFNHHWSENKSSLVLCAQKQTKNGWESMISEQVVLHMDVKTLEVLLKESGFTKVEYYGNYQEAAFDEKGHQNIVGRASRI